jgi:hypothetical protein
MKSHLLAALLGLHLHRGAAGCEGERHGDWSGGPVNYKMQLKGDVKRKVFGLPDTVLVLLSGVLISNWQLNSQCHAF